MTGPEIGAEDMRHLQRCVQLAGEAVDAGDEPFGSVLVSAEGTVRAEDRNRISGGDATRHPEFALAKWAAQHLDSGARAASVVYTSGEHCPMCAAAHAWAGLGRIVYATSTAQLVEWFEELGIPPAPVAALPIGQVAPGVPVAGPVAELAPQVRALHARAHGARG